MKGQAVRADVFRLRPGIITGQHNGGPVEIIRACALPGQSSRASELNGDSEELYAISSLNPLRLGRIKNKESITGIYKARKTRENGQLKKKLQSDRITLHRRSRVSLTIRIAQLVFEFRVISLDLHKDRAMQDTCNVIIEQNIYA